MNNLKDELSAKARLVCILVCIAVTLIAPMSAQTGAWTPPVVLSTGGQGWEAAAAIDGNGNSVALWDERTTQDQLWSRSKASGGNWGSVTKVSPALQTTSVFPAVRISSGRIRYGSVERFKRRVDSRSPARFEMGFPSASDPRRVKSDFCNEFARRCRDSLDCGRRSKEHQRLGNGRSAACRGSLDGTTDSRQRRASLRRSCRNRSEWRGDCHLGDLQRSLQEIWLRAEQLCSACLAAEYGYRRPGSTRVRCWGPIAHAHDARVALDSAGGAILVALSSSGVYTSATQGNSGGAWSPFKTVVNPQGSTIISDLASDDAGQVTLVYESIVYPTSQVLAVSGSISNNTWSSPVVLSGADTSVGQVYFALAPSGAALAIWLSSSGTPAIHAVTRATATGTWSTPVSVSGPGTYIAPEAAAVESSGNAIVIYSGYDTASVHTEYATNYQP